MYKWNEVLGSKNKSVINENEWLVFIVTNTTREVLLISVSVGYVLIDGYIREKITLDVRPRSYSPTSV